MKSSLKIFIPSQRTDHENQSIKTILILVFKGGGGCGRFWNLHILEICSLYKRHSRISFCMVRDKCMLLILLNRNVCLIFKIAENRQISCT